MDFLAVVVVVCPVDAVRRIGGDVEAHARETGILLSDLWRNKSGAATSLAYLFCMRGRADISCGVTLLAAFGVEAAGSVSGCVILAASGENAAGSVSCSVTVLAASGVKGAGSMTCPVLTAGVELTCSC